MESRGSFESGAGETGRGEKAGDCPRPKQSEQISRPFAPSPAMRGRGHSAGRSRGAHLQEPGPLPRALPQRAEPPLLKPRPGGGRRGLSGPAEEQVGAPPGQVRVERAHPGRGEGAGRGRAGAQLC